MMRPDSKGQQDEARGGKRGINKGDANQMTIQNCTTCVKQLKCLNQGHPEGRLNTKTRKCCFYEKDEEKNPMYKVTQRYYNNGKVFAEISEVHKGDDLTPFTELKTHDEYIDTFETHEEARTFYEGAINA